MQRYQRTRLFGKHTKKVNQLFFLIILVVLGSPDFGFSSDRYQPLDDHFVGYTEQETDTAVFDIHYSGAMKQSHELVGRYALLRSAELAEEMGFATFIIDSFLLSNEPDVQIYKTCSDVRVVANGSLPAASLSVRYLPENSTNLTLTFPAAEILAMKDSLLTEGQDFDLALYLSARGVSLTDETSME